MSCASCRIELLTNSSTYRKERTMNTESVLARILPAVEQMIKAMVTQIAQQTTPPPSTSWRSKRIRSSHRSARYSCKG